jgi:hypothetical protein
MRFNASLSQHEDDLLNSRVPAPNEAECIPACCAALRLVRPKGYQALRLEAMCGAGGSKTDRGLLVHAKQPLNTPTRRQSSTIIMIPRLYVE